MLDRERAVQRISEVEELLRTIREDLLSTEESAEVMGQGLWRQSMLSTIYPHVSSSPGVIALFDEAADHPGEVVSYVTVLERSGLSDQEQRNAHAGLSRLSRKLLGRKTWPVSAWQEASDGVMRYRMPAIVAAWWNDLRAA